MSKAIHVVQLYPRQMNIYGDNGNLKTVQWRLEKRGYSVKTTYVHQGESFPHDTDIVVCGGGQDSGQSRVQADLQKKAEELRAMRDDGVVMLAVCGMYQLFGHYFETAEGEKIMGASVIDATTKAGPERLIGNIVLDTQFGRMVGFENHSGETTLEAGVLPLGSVMSGAGNSRAANFEGAISHNVFATYLHGPVLPKNPRFADELLVRAIERRHGSTQLEQIDDSLASQAATIHGSRPR